MTFWSHITMTACKQKQIATYLIDFEIYLQFSKFHLFNNFSSIRRQTIDHL